MQTQAKISNILDTNSISLGHTWGIEAGKQRGNFTYGLEYYGESDSYDPNDLGFLRANNSRVGELYIGYIAPPSAFPSVPVIISTRSITL